MNIFDLLESPGMGRPRDTKGIQSAADQSAASVIGSGTTEREEKKKPVTMMGKNIKEGFDLGGVKNWLLKLKQGLSTEADETKAMFDTYVRYTQGQASEQEMSAANEQFKDLLRGLGMGTLAAMPGSVVTLPLVFKLAKKFNIELMPSAFKNDVEEAVVKPDFKMPPESLQDKMYRQHQELRKQRGAPSAEEYKERIAQKQKEIDALKEGILDRGVPKMPKPRNPANAVLGNKVNAAGKHLDKKRRQELAPKHKHKDPLDEGAISNAIASAALAGSMALGGAAHAAEPVVGTGQSQNMQMAVDMAKMNAKVKYMKTVYGDNFQDKQMPDYHWGKVDLKPGKDGGYQATVPLIVDNEVQESTGPLNWTVHFDDGTSQQVTIPSDEFDVRGYFAKRGKKVVKIDYSFRAQDRQDPPGRAKDDPAAQSDSLAKAQAAYDRGLTEQDVEEEFRLGKRLGTRRDRFKSLRKRKDGILGEEDVEEGQAVKITDYDTWSDKVKALGGEIHPQKDRNLLVAQSWDGEEIGKFHLGKNMGFINQSGDLDETIRKMGSQYRLLSKKGKNLGTFDTKAGAKKHEREVQYFKHKNMEEGSTNDPRFQKMMGNIQKSTPTLVTGYVALEFASERKSNKIKGVTRNGKPIPDVINNPEEELGGKIEFTPDQIEQQLMSIGRKYGWDSIDPGQGRGYTELFFETTKEYTSDTQNLLATNILKTVNAINKFFNSINSSLQATGLPGYTTSVWQGMGPSDDINKITNLRQISKIATDIKRSTKNTSTSDDVGVKLGNAILAHYKEFGPDGGYSKASLNLAAKIGKIYITQGERAGLEAQMKAGSVSEMIDELLSDAGLSGERTIWELDEFAKKGVAEGWKGKVAGAALAGAAALGGGDADAQNIDLPGPQVSYVAHVSAEANGREVYRTVNLGSRYSSEQEAYDDIERSLQAKGITRYNINIEQKYDAQYYPGSNQPRGGSATGRDYGTPGIGDMVIKHIGREIRAGIPSKGGYATGGTNRGERPRDGSQWWRDQLPQMREDELAEDIESHLYLMSRAGYDIVQEEWSDKYKDSINCSNPKGFSQKAHCAGKKKNKSVAEAVATPPAQTTDPYQQKLLDRMGARFGLQPGATMDQVQAAQQAHLDKNDPAAAAQYKQNMTNIDTGNTAANKPVQLAPKTPNPDTTAALAAGKANKSPTAIMLSQPGIGQNQAMLDAIAPTLGLPVGSSLEQLLAADDARHAKGGGKYAPSSQPVGEDMDQAIDSKGRTQQQWMQLVKDKFPDAKIIQSKMINGPCQAILSDGRKLSWSKVKEDVSEEKDACYSKVKSRYKVWPSAYASGALVRCRKVGAANWGNKSKK